MKKSNESKQQEFLPSIKVERLRYENDLKLIAHLPYKLRIRAETRFFLIKESEKFLKKEAIRLGKGFLRKAALKQFCHSQDVSIITYYRILKKYRQGGIIALVPLIGRYTRHENKNGGTIIRIVEIDTKDPLSFLSDFVTIIKRTSLIDSATKQTSAAALNHILKYFKGHYFKYQPVSLCRRLNQEEINLLTRYLIESHKNHRARARALLLANRNFSLIEIALEVRRSPGTVLRWIRRFKDEGIGLVETTYDCTKGNPERAVRLDNIVKILHRSPRDYGINRSSWTLQAISQAYKDDHNFELSAGTIRRALKKTNYTWRRAKRVLTSNDPKYIEKTKRVLDALRDLKEDEAFFFIDEAGPWRVKKYGGRSYTAKGKTKKYPQFQKSKGRITFIGALDAVRNQVIWAFTETKDTASVVCLMRTLYYRYHDYSGLYFTWDCASWHNSTGVQNCVQLLNNMAAGPSISIYPLPSRSQYLNVVESVFSGLKRAVIHNSDYRCVYEMKSAISQHFRDRNHYFKLNPERAGNKIWDREYYEVEKLESGLFRKK